MLNLSHGYMKCFLLLSLLVANVTVHAQVQKKTSDKLKQSLNVPTVTKKYNPPVQQRNTPPVADAGPDKTITLPTNSVTLDGSAQDRENNIIHYGWTQLSGPSTGTIQSLNTPQTTVTDLLEGTYRYILTAIDRYKAVGRDTMTITVNAAALPPTANAGPDQTLTLPTNTTQLNGSGSDPRGYGLRFAWDKLSGPANIQIITPTRPQTRVEGLTEGSYQLVLTVTNNAGLSAVDTVVIIVNQLANQPPSVKAERKKPIRLPLNSLTLTGTGRDPDGDPLTYSWREVSGPSKSDISSPASATTEVGNLQQGVYQFVVTVDDNKGGIATDTVSITVNAAAPPPPTTTASDTPVIGPIPQDDPPISRTLPIWTWIAIGLPLLAGAAYVFYIFWWPRPQKKVLIFFMNPEEEALAHKLLPSPQRTEGYVMGDASHKDIKRMKKKGLALRILNTSTLTVSTPGVSRTYKYTSKKGVPVLTSVSSNHPGYNFVNILQGIERPKDNTWPAFYIMTLDGPMLDVFRRRLEEVKVIVLQRIPDDSYIIQVNEPHQLDALQNKERFGFIRAISPYTAEDTGFTVRKDRYSTTFMSGPDAVFTMDVVLHREEDRAIVRDFLGLNGVGLLDAVGKTIRIRMRANTELPLLLASNKYIQAIYEHVPRKWHNDIARQIIGIDDSAFALDRLELA